MENPIATSKIESQKEMKRLALEQKEKRRIEELEEKRKEIEEMKRKRQERREQRILEEQQKKALALENENLEKTNTIEGEVEEVVEKVEAQVVERDETTEVHLEYETDSSKSLELDSGSELESQAGDAVSGVPGDSVVESQVAIEPADAVVEPALETVAEPQPKPVEKDEFAVPYSQPMQVDGGDDLMDLLSGTFDPTQKTTVTKFEKSESILDVISGTFPSDSQKETMVEPSQGQATGILDLLSGSFAETQQVEPEDSPIPEPIQVVEEPVQVEVDLVKISESERESENESESELEKSEGEPDCSQEYSSQSSPKASPKEVTIQDILDMDQDSDESDLEEETVDQVAETQPEDQPEDPNKLFVKWSVVENINKKLQKSGPNFVETEAEVEEDEFMNVGGADGEELNGKDEYDKSMLADSDEDVGDTKAVMELHHQQLADADETIVNNIINDVTSGAYRKRKSMREGAMGLDLYDSDEETEAILRRIRQRMGLTHTTSNGELSFDPNSLESLASNPKTKAFAQVFQGKEEERSGYLSSSEDESKIETFKTRVKTSHAKRKLYKSTSQSDISQSESSQTVSQVSIPSIPENFASEIVNQIKSKYTNKKPIQKSSSNLIMKSSTRLLTKKSILTSIEEGIVRESHSNSNTKSNGTFKIRSASVNETKLFSVEKEVEKKSKPKAGLVSLFSRNSSFR